MRRDGGDIVVEDSLADGDGTDRLVQIEVVRFADGDVDLEALLASAAEPFE